jgi:hypothetical protein
MAARQVKLEFVKTYATEANAIKAAEKAYGDYQADLRYIVIPTKDGRFGIAFLGEVALQHMVHFRFNVLM